MAVIEMHSTWLAINSILGCPNGCKYCFLQATGDNCSLPKQLVTPKEAVKQLLKHKYYDEKIPVCLLPNTDAFVNPKNIEYLIELLDEIDKNNIKNDLIIITKCKITKNVIDRIKKLKNEKGNEVVFYISYSGLSKYYEPNISEENILYNFRLLKENNIKTIHYFRPLLPENSSTEKIEKMLNTVNEFTDISVISGLNLIPTFVDKIDFWNDIQSKKEQALKSSCVYPNSAYEYFNNGYSHSQKIFQTNTCALNTKLNKPSHYYGSEECLNRNHCSDEQRNICKINFEKLNRDFEIKLKTLLIKLGYDVNNLVYEITSNGLEIKNIELQISDLSYLSYVLGIKTYITTNNIVEKTYNCSLNGAKPLVLKAGGRV